MVQKSIASQRDLYTMVDNNAIVFTDVLGLVLQDIKKSFVSSDQDIIDVWLFLDKGECTYDGPEQCPCEQYYCHGEIKVWLLYNSMVTTEDRATRAWLRDSRFSLLGSDGTHTPLELLTPTTLAGAQDLGKIPCAGGPLKTSVSVKWQSDDPHPTPNGGEDYISIEQQFDVAVSVICCGRTKDAEIVGKGLRVTLRPK